jgi:hypothetical protein
MGAWVFLGMSDCSHDICRHSILHTSCTRVTSEHPLPTPLPYIARTVPELCHPSALVELCHTRPFHRRRKYSRISNNISKCKIAYKIAISKQASRARTHHQRSSGRCFATRPFTSKAQHDQWVMNTDSARRKHSLMPWKTSVTWLMKVWHLHSIHLF